jgi:2-keto-4-pentenoate hydratase
MRDPDAERKAASLIQEAAATGIPCPPVRDLLPKADVDAAYRVQQIIVEEAVTAGARVVGRKIGLTSTAVQHQLGVDQPDYGVLFAHTAYGETLPIPWSAVLQPKIEAEVALVLERDLASEQPTVADLLRAIAFVVPAVEIVGSRIAEWDITIVDTIADNASAGAYVLGGPARRVDAVDLAATSMQLALDGQVVAEGTGRACLGHPLNAAVWLARRLAELGDPLRSGDVVLTGALGPMVPVMPGSSFEATFSGIGSVRANFAEI